MATAVRSTAYISPDGLYRYTLTRHWSEPVTGSVCWIMLNPSTADAEKDDPTIRRCMTFSDAWGYDGLVVVNLFAYRATKPADLKRASDPTGPENDDAIFAAAARCAITVAAWGNHGSYRGRSGNVRQMLMNNRIPLYCLDRAKDGQPKHPLYLPSDLTPVLMDGA